MKVINSTKEIKSIISTLNDKNKGFVCIEDVIDKKILHEIKSEIKKYIKDNGYTNYLSITNPLKKDFQSFKNLQKKINLIDFTEQLTEKYLSYFLSNKAVENILKNDELLSVLRYVSGSQTSFGFHYDKTIITILVPILIPKIDIKKSGHLIAFPNSRKIKKNSFFNFIDKVILQNNITKKLFSLKKFGSDSIKIMKEGNIYIMNGYKTIHANYPVDKTQERITLLLHYGDPHVNSKLLKTITFCTTLVKKIKGTII
ncbi:MAG: hypothetical protein CL869_01805 [Cytophagia bacterium]|nr:hypothetical protein [Cytophagia bacterium]